MLEGAFVMAGEAALALFTMREIAEAVENWGKFKDKITEIVGPISQVEVHVANMLGLLYEYRSELTDQAVKEQKAIEHQHILIEKMLDDEEKVKQARLSGIALIQEENRYEYEKGKQALTNADANDKSFQIRINQAKEELGQIKLGQEFNKQLHEDEQKGRENARKAAEARKRANREQAEDNSFISAWLEKCEKQDEATLKAGTLAQLHAINERTKAQAEFAASLAQMNAQLEASLSV